MLKNPRSSVIRVLLTRRSIFTCNTNQKPLYPTHSPTSFIKKTVIAAGASLISLANPERADMVAALGETTGNVALLRMREQMRQSEEV
jgi:ubiquinone biosynthesis protein COQ4